MKRVVLQPAYVLHRRPYRETSFLIELFCADLGRVTVVARGARRPKSGDQGILQPFTPLIVSFAGKGELMALTHAETSGSVSSLQGACLFAGFYLNELLVYLLQKWDPHRKLYNIYSDTVTALRTPSLNQGMLRSFEKSLLEELGYGLLPRQEFGTRPAFEPELFYRFIPEQGFVLSGLGDAQGKQTNVFSGRSLLAIANEDWHDEVCLKDAKRLMRYVLAPLLGARTIYSRQLFIQEDE